MGKRKAITETEGYAVNMLSEVKLIPLGLIDEPELPSREGMDTAAMEDLKSSMRDIGLLSPIVVVTRGARYQTVAGHRRLLAARDLGWDQIRCLVYPEGWEDSPAAMLHENVIREELNPAQEAVFFQQLIERHNLDEEGLCKLVKRSPSYISERVRLLRGDERIFQALRDGVINFAVAKVLNKFPEPEDRAYNLHQAIASGTSARVVEQWYRAHMGNLQPPPASTTQPAAALPQPEQEPYQFACFLCGGNRDPYNLVTVQIHKWELAEIQRRMNKPLDEHDGEVDKKQVQ